MANAEWFMLQKRAAGENCEDPSDDCAAARHRCSTRGQRQTRLTYADVWPDEPALLARFRGLLGFCANSAALISPSQVLPLGYSLVASRKRASSAALLALFSGLFGFLSTSAAITSLRGWVDRIWNTVDRKSSAPNILYLICFFLLE